MKTIVLCFLLILTLLPGCGQTHIFVSNPNTRIFINQQYYGKGSAEVKRMGVPKKYLVEAKNDEGVIGSLIIKRRFDPLTFVIGYFTYGIGFICAWRFPANIYVPTSESKPSESNIDKGNSSPWDQPSKSTW